MRPAQTCRCLRGPGPRLPPEPGPEPQPAPGRQAQAPADRQGLSVLAKAPPTGSSSTGRCRPTRSGKIRLLRNVDDGELRGLQEVQDQGLPGGSTKRHLPGRWEEDLLQGPGARYDDLPPRPASPLRPGLHSFSRLTHALVSPGRETMRNKVPLDPRARRGRTPHAPHTRIVAALIPRCSSPPPCRWCRSMAHQASSGHTAVVEKAKTKVTINFARERTPVVQELFGKVHAEARERRSPSCGPARPTAATGSSAALKSSKQGQAVQNGPEGVPETRPR